MANNLISLAYPFSAILFIDKLRPEMNQNYFQVKGHTLPDFKIYEGIDIKYKGDPSNQIVKNYTWAEYSLDLFLNNDYTEYKYLLDWMQQLQDHREYLHSWKDNGVGLLSDMSLFILNSKEEKISLGLRFLQAYPLSINSLTFEKRVEPFTIKLNFKYLYMERIPETLYSSIPLISMI